MEFRIADTFTDSLGKLTSQEQRAVKTTAFDLQMNPANPGIRFHKLDKCKDPNFWSASASMDLRIIVHRTDNSLLLCYVDHHDKAYRWAERRRLETHPKTGAAQLVEIRETIKEVVVPNFEQQPLAVGSTFLFNDISDEVLHGYGVPQDWIADVKRSTEDSLFDLIEHLPQEAGEALLDLATGVTPNVIQRVSATDPFAHPDAQRRFRLFNDVAELEQALDYPWEKWTVFLHPAQRKIVERDYSGPARVSGSAGTGKTIVALHRAVHLVRNNEDARVLLTTFSAPLAHSLHTKMSRLLAKEPRLAERLEILSMNDVGKRLYQANLGPLKLAPNNLLSELISNAASAVTDNKFSTHFLDTEWKEVVDAWNLKTWEEYRDVARLGRKTRLPEKQRMIAWKIFEKVRNELSDRGLITTSEMFSSLSDHYSSTSHAPFDFAIVDEAQDISIFQLRFLAALSSRSDSLFFAGDLGQRIFQQPFSWKSAGVDVRGRSNTLRINYRTSHQIRKQADLLLEAQISDVDGNVEDRNGTQSVFNGPRPLINVAEEYSEEERQVGDWLISLTEQGYSPKEIGVFVRSENEIDRARRALGQADLPYSVLDEKVLLSPDKVSLCTMHLAKGLEFKAVVVMACDDEVIPSQDRIDKVVDDSDLEEVYNTERHLLYVACTRARDHLLVTSVDPESEFLDDLLG